MEANDLLMGGGIKSAAFPNQQFGTRVGGRILRTPTVRQQNDFDTGKPKFWDNGDPMMQVVVSVATEQRDPTDPNDDGERAIYIKAQMQQAVREAVKATGAKGLEVGGLLHITYIRDEPNSKGRGNPKKIYSAEYAPPAAANNALMGGNGNNQQGAQPEWSLPAQQAQQYMQAVSQPAHQPQQPVQQAFASAESAMELPAGVTPEVWAQLSADQRAKVLAASNR